VRAAAGQRAIAHHRTHHTPLCPCDR
jgi:hypothetical protein